MFSDTILSKFQGIKARNKLETFFKKFDQLGEIDYFESILQEAVYSYMLENMDNDLKFTSTFTTFEKMYEKNLEKIFPSKIEKVNQILETVLSNAFNSFFFDQKSFFPIIRMDEFSENYQNIYSLIAKIFKAKSQNLPENLRISVAKKQNLIYKSYVTQVIKGIETCLILFKKCIGGQDDVSRDEIVAKLERLLNKKFQNSGDLGAILLDMIQENFDSKVVTRPLISKIFSLNLRIISRIDSFCQEDQIIQCKIFEYLMKKMLDLQRSVEQNIDSSVQNMFDRVYSDYETTQLENIQQMFRKKVEKLKTSLILSILRKFMLEQNLDLGKEVADLAVKLQLTGDIQDSGSIIVNKIQNFYERFKQEKNLKNWNLEIENLSSSYTSLIEEFLVGFYQYQIDHALDSEQTGGKYNSGTKLSEMIQNQLEIDLALLIKSE